MANNKFKHRQISAQSAMAEFDNPVTTDGNPKIFSLKFLLKDGREKIVPRGIKSGVNNKDMGATDTKGIQPVDKEYNKIGHPIPFKWYFLIEFNKMEVSL